MRNKKLLIAVILSFTLILSTVPAFADFTDVNVNSVNIVANNVTVAVSGESYTLDNGIAVPNSILYKSTTYLPMRKICEFVGKEVTFDKTTKSANIISTTGAITTNQSSTQTPKNGTKENLNLMFNSINILVDGKSVAKVGDSYVLKNGATVPFSILYKGTTYLPMRKVGELTNKNIGYDSKTKTAELRDPVANYTEYPTVPDFGLIAVTDLIKKEVKDGTATYLYLSKDLSLAEHEMFVNNLDKNGFVFKERRDMPEISPEANAYVYNNTKEKLMVLYGAMLYENKECIFISIAPSK